MQKFNQVSGGNCRLVLYRESAPNIVDSKDDGVVVSMLSESLAINASKKSSAVISGKRGAGKPYEGIPDYSGGVKIAPYAPLMGHILRALCGICPSKPTDPPVNFSGEVSNEGDNYVGLPCQGNTFIQDTVVSVYGSTHYDGTYRIEYGSTPTKIIIKAPYVAETLDNTVKIFRGRSISLQGEVRSSTSTLVILPAKGNSITEGDTVQIVGTTNYDGSYTLQPGSSDNALLIEADFTEETLNAIAFPSFTKHEFTLPRKQPTVTLEKHLDFDEGAATNPYICFSSCKMNSLSFSFGGADEIALDLDFSVGNAERRALPSKNKEPALLPAISFADKEFALWIDNKRVGDIESGSIDLQFSIEGKSAVGDLGKRSRQPEGDPVCTCSLSAFLEHDEYAELAESAATIPFSLSCSGTQGEEFHITFPESEMDIAGAQISGKGGLNQELTITSFVDKQDAAVTFTLINRVASYE